MFKAELIKKYIKEKGITVKKFCEKCEISVYNYNKLMNNNLKVRISVLYKICKTTKIKAKTLLDNN